MQRTIQKGKERFNVSGVKEMKKEPKIRILKNKVNSDGSYTFLVDSNNAFYSQTSLGYTNTKEIEEKKEAEKLKEMNEKVRSKKDVKRLSYGLKFTKPSQRNHSSIYE